MREGKVQILVANDDSITSKGIRVLTEVVSEIENTEVIVVAPDSPQSGMGHAITIHTPIKIRKSEVFADLGVEAYQCSGTPADCVKMAKSAVLPHCNPDIVVSGINHGSNASINILYSGTMSATIEGAIEGAHAIGFSLCNYSADAEFSHIRAYVKQITTQVIKTGLPKGVALNVNFPAYNEQKTIKGIKICRQAGGTWKESFEERQDPYGGSYHWLTGEFNNTDKGEDTDIWALNNQYISVVPCLFDLTAHNAVGMLNQEWDI